MAAADPMAAQAWVRGVVGYVANHTCLVLFWSFSRKATRSIGRPDDSHSNTHNHRILCTRAASLSTTLASHLPFSPSSPSSSSGGLGLTQQIFRPEPDNLYEEPAVVAYWAVRSLLVAMAAGPVGDGWSSFSPSSGVAAAASCGELRALLLPLLVDGGTDGARPSLLQRALEGSVWVGGLTNHPEVLPGLFVSLLAALLLLVLSEREEEDEKLIVRLVNAAQETNRGTEHVLIRWALDSLAAVLAASSGAGGDAGGVRTWWAAAAAAVAWVDWRVVDGYGPFVRPELPPGAE